MKTELRKVFDALSTIYETQVDSSSYYNAEYERPGMLAEIAENLSDKSILDAGCAAGWYTNELLVRGASVTAIDISPQMVEAARRRIGERGKIYCVDLEQALPFADASFDIIVSSLTLHYIRDWSSTFKEFNRILKKGGEIIYSVHHPFMDIKNAGEQGYFETEAYVDSWHKDGQKFEVPMFRRPLHAIINETTKAFKLNAVKELKPTEQLKELARGSYDYLMSHPHFLVVKGTKE